MVTVIHSILLTMMMEKKECQSQQVNQDPHQD